MAAPASDSLPVDRLPLRASAPLDFLRGVRVLDLTTSIAGPAATQLLADLGASVLKLEKPPRGDDARAWGPPFLDGQSLWFMSVNRNKHSMRLDVASQPGYDLLARLVRRADVIVLNHIPRAQAKLKIDYESLRVLNPHLIHVSITGFGLTGRRADLTCYDLIAEGYAGIMDLTGEPDGPAQKVGTPAADLLAGTDAALAAVAALLRRQRDGRGCQVDVSLVASMLRFVGPRLMSYLGSGRVARRTGGRDSVIAIYQVFDTADQPLTLSLGNDAIWQRFWRAVGQPGFGEDQRYLTNAQRCVARAEIVAAIGAILRQRPRAQWLEIFEQAQVPAGPINRLDEVAADPEFAEHGLVYAVEHNGRRVPQVGLGIRFDGLAEGCVQPPPELGEGGWEALREWLGLTSEELERLQGAHAI